MACVDSSRSSLAGLGHLYVFTAIKDTRAGWYRVAGCLVDMSLVKYRLPNWIKIIGFTPSRIALEHSHLQLYDSMRGCTGN